MKAGIPRSKLRVGIHFHRVVWHGATGPNQPITGVKTEGTYTRANGFGEVIIWELTGDYNPAKPIAQRDPLMAAIRAAVGAGP